MVRKASATTKDKKQSTKRLKKNGAPQNNTGTSKRTASHSKDDQPPQLKKQKLLKIKHPFDTVRSGVALALGQGEFGQLGLGEDVMSRKKPALISREIAGKRIKKVVAGGMHTVCLTDDHKIFTFGCNDEGSLGRETSDDCEEFEPGIVGGVVEDIKIIDVTAGDSHTAALSEEGTVYLWGCFRDNHGKLGLVKEWEGSKSPIALTMVKTPVMRIASGCDHLAMLTVDGKVLTMGCGEQGQLGRIGRYFLNRSGRRSAESAVLPGRSRSTTRTADAYLVPKSIILPKVKGEAVKPVSYDVFCGSFNTYVVSTNGDVFAFGLNNYNQLGIPDEDSRFMPVHVPALSNKRWKMLSGGQHHVILLDDQGDVFSMGRGEYGRLGLGKDVAIANEPMRVGGLKNVVHIATGPCVSFAVDKAGKAYGWGMGTNLQLTTGSEDDEWSAVQLSGKNLEERSVIAVDGGGQHTVILACGKSEMVTGDGAS